MEKTLIVYDSTGRIINQTSGSVAEPVGIPFLWVEIPAGKKVVSVDTTVTPNVPVFEDIQKTEVEVLKEQLAKLEAELNSRMTTNEEMNLMVLEAMADVYEAVLPFLPI